jgi:hypothetical protein
LSVLFAFAILMLVRFSPAADEWLPVPPEDLTMKDNLKQPGADAMVLYREVRVDAKQSSVNNYLRIKVFSPNRREGPSRH